MKGLTEVSFWKSKAGNQVKKVMNYKQGYFIKQQVFLQLLLISSFSYGQQKVIQLYQGKPSGSEKWDWQEQTIVSNPSKAKITYNVVSPTLTIFPAQGPLQTGTAVVIAPGGGLFTLSMNSEGNEVAERLSTKGITAFVLKYRLVPITGNPASAFGTACYATGYA